MAEEDKVVAEIKRNYPGWSEEQVYDEVDRLADIYENERFNHIIKSYGYRVSKYGQGVTENSRSIKNSFLKLVG